MIEEKSTLNRDWSTLLVNGYLVRIIFYAIHRPREGNIFWLKLLEFISEIIDMLDQGIVVFGKKKFSDILEEIYNNQQKKDKQVTALINELKPLISEIGDATLVVPLIKEYMEISVKNDDLLIKMAALAQRAMATQTAEGALTISDEEKEQLLAAMNELKGEK